MFPRTAGPECTVTNTDPQTTLFVTKEASGNPRKQCPEPNMSCAESESSVAPEHHELDIHVVVQQTFIQCSMQKQVALHTCKLVFHCASNIVKQLLYTYTGNFPERLLSILFSIAATAHCVAATPSSHCDNASSPLCLPNVTVAPH